MQLLPMQPMGPQLSSQLSQLHPNLDHQRRHRPVLPWGLVRLGQLSLMVATVAARLCLVVATVAATLAARLFLVVAVVASRLSLVVVAIAMGATLAFLALASLVTLVSLAVATLSTNAAQLPQPHGSVVVLSRKQGPVVWLHC